MAFYLSGFWDLKWLKITYMNLFIYWQKQPSEQAIFANFFF